MFKKERKVPEYFINAFYESKFRDNIFVVKASGNVIENEKARDNMIANIKELVLHGIKVILIYGGGHAIDVELATRHIDVKKVEGRRITDTATMDVIKEILGGDLSLDVYKSMHKYGLDGLSFNAVPSNWMDVHLRSKKPVDYGFVGDIDEINPRPILRQLKVNGFIACACISISEKHTLCNINADTIATRIASGVNADKLIFMTDVDGVKVNDKTAMIITDTEIPSYIKNGTVTGGMKVKLENCQKALEAGVKRIHLINGLRKNALHKEIFESVGPGTMLFRAEERENYLNEVNIQKVIGGK
ncbi:MAG: hypothetical protein GC137_00830 [Alphaproteobacteria bacterium]|nr:hypothetical protein [Alphaproteobacteria bacterium]